MAWTYSDWETAYTGADSLSRLRLHIQEVSDTLSAEMSAAGKSIAFTSLNSYLSRLEKRRDDLRQLYDANTVSTQIGLVGFGGAAR